MLRRRVSGRFLRHWALAAVVTSAASSLAPAAQAQAPGRFACAGVDYNAMILDIIRRIPDGGGYSLGSSFELPTVTSHNIGGGNWQMRVYDGRPSHCASATYTVFAHLAADLNNSGRITLRPGHMLALMPRKRTTDGRPLVDGQGSYQIFNANGAGVAAFLKHTGTGFSFRDDDLAYARAGDFLKLFWNNGVGSSEQGHQVIYTGRRSVAGRDMVCFWSSQRQNTKKRGRGKESLYFPAHDGAKVEDGFGEVCRPRSDIKAMIFSRLTCMERLAAGLDALGAKAAADGGAPDIFIDEYLYSLRTRSSDQATLDRMYGILPAAGAVADGATGSVARPR